MGIIGEDLVMGMAGASMESRKDVGQKEFFFSERNSRLQLRLQMDLFAGQGGYEYRKIRFE